MILSIDEEKTFASIQNPIMIRTQKARNKGSFLNMTSHVPKNLLLIAYFVVQYWMHSPKQRIKRGFHPHHCVQYWTCIKNIFFKITTLMNI